MRKQIPWGVIFLPTTEEQGRRGGGASRSGYLTPDLWVRRWVKLEASRSLKRLLGLVQARWDGGLGEAGGEGDGERCRRLRSREEVE